MTRPAIEKVVRKALLARGWILEPSPELNEEGEKREFLHPKSRQPYTWIEALTTQFYDIDPFEQASREAAARAARAAYKPAITKRKRK